MVSRPIAADDFEQAVNSILLAHESQPDRRGAAPSGFVVVQAEDDDGGGGKPPPDRRSLLDPVPAQRLEVDQNDTRSYRTPNSNR
jgi:hypothetical protein